MLSFTHKAFGLISFPENDSVMIYMLIIMGNEKEFNLINLKGSR